MNRYKNWEIKKDNQQIIWLGINVKEKSTNVLSSETLNELNSILQDISQLDNVLGLVIHSLKDNGFIAGADVHEFANFNKNEQVIEFLRKGQSVFAKLESLPMPKVAIIHGFCMGGGLELALACDYRIATNASNTKIGLPEVMLGIHPGWGGTVRLPKLIGGYNALSQVILTGKPLNFKRAQDLGVIDDAVPLRQLKRAAQYFICNKPNKHKPNFIHSLTNFSCARKVISRLLRHVVSKKINIEHYPAPFAIIDLWEKDGGMHDRSYLKEADSVQNLIESGQTAKNLTKLFLIKDRLKDFSKENNFTVKHIHVIGAGVMGGDIAAWCALKNLTVTIQDQTYSQISNAINRANKLFQKKLRKPRLIQTAFDNLIPDPEGEGIKSADLIIEAVFENLEVKHAILKNVEQKAKSSALIATNTSSLSLDEISSIMKNPEKLVGIHFFNPVAQMEIVEVVHSAKTLNEITKKACSFVGQIGKLPLPVKSSPGFLINRVLTPYLIEAMQLIEEGYEPEVIDDAAKNFGMLMGPVELADTIGLDICLAVAENLSKLFSYKIPDKIYSMIENKQLGRKVGSGFYKYKNNKPIKKRLSLEKRQPELAKRLIQPMIDEAKKCIKDGVVADADLLDGGMVFAAGFAPFRGGPMQYSLLVDISINVKAKTN